jgi:hypothetical protein
MSSRARTVLLVSALGLGCAGLLVPSQADGRRAPEAWGQGSALTAGQSTGQGPAQHQGRGKRKRGKKTGVGEGRAGGAHRSRALTRAQEAKVECAAAFDKAKETANGAQIREANEWFAVCAQPSCGRSMSKRCSAVHARIAAMIPSVVPVVTDSDGITVRDVVVRMDGESLTSNLDGSAIVVDPGDHQFTFSKDGEVFATRKLAIERGQQRQVVSAKLPPRKRDEGYAAPVAVTEESAPTRAPRKVPAVTKDVAAAREGDGEGAADDEHAPNLVKRESARRSGEQIEESHGAPWSAYALAGVGLLGVGSYATFNLKGSADNDALVAFCKPSCKPESIRHVRNLYLAADISLGIGLAALAGSTYLFFRSPDSAEEDSSRIGRGHISQIGVAPTSAGALATVGGTV